MCLREEVELKNGETQLDSGADRDAHQMMCRYRSPASLVTAPICQCSDAEAELARDALTPGNGQEAPRDFGRKFEVVGQRLTVHVRVTTAEL